MNTRSLLREPLLHFLALGALLFGVYAWLERDAGAAPDEIVIDASRVDTLIAEYTQLWQRPPTPAELEALIDSWLRDEILYREGLALGLDRNDPAIRLLVAQKLSFLFEDLASAPPTEQELEDWLAAHADDYRIEPAWSFRQLYFDPARHPESLEATIADARSALAGGADPAGIGDRSLLQHSMSAASLTAVRRSFGDAFAAALADLAPGNWEGPVRSAYGVHLVRIDALTPGRAATLDEVRAAVERDLAAAARQDNDDALYASLREHYRVRIDADLPASIDAKLRTGNQ